MPDELVQHSAHASARVRLFNFNIGLLHRTVCSPGAFGVVNINAQFDFLQRGIHACGHYPGNTGNKNATGSCSISMYLNFEMAKVRLLLCVCVFVCLHGMQWPKKETH